MLCRDRRGGCTLNLEYKAGTWKTHYKEGVTIVVLHWWDYGGIGDGLATDSGGPQGECVWGGGALVRCYGCECRRKRMQPDLTPKSAVISKIFFFLKLFSL